MSLVLEAIVKKRRDRYPVLEHIGAGARYIDDNVNYTFWHGDFAEYLVELTDDCDSIIRAATPLWVMI